MVDIKLIQGDCLEKMNQLPRKWHVGYAEEYDIDAGDDGRTIGYPTGESEFDGTVFMVDGEDQIEIIAEHIRDEKTAHRIAALWNMAERLGLSTEEIESGNVETKLKTAHDMLEALGEVMGELDVEGLPCPLCGRNLTIGHRHNCLWHVVASAIRKARGEV